MKQITPQSEDFLYWDPEDICNYPIKHGPEDHWICRPGNEPLKEQLNKYKEAENE